MSVTKRTTRDVRSTGVRGGGDSEVEEPAEGERGTGPAGGSRGPGPSEPAGGAADPTGRAEGGDDQHYRGVQKIIIVVCTVLKISNVVKVMALNQEIF